jgi:signal transduction histidine kinase
MKRSIKHRYHQMIGILFGFIALQFIAVLFAIAQADNLYALASDIQSIMIVFMFMIFVYIVVIFNYLPYRLNRAIKRVEDLIDEISNGNYQIDIDSSLFEHDRDFENLIYALQKMLDIIIRFDAAKADKIYEHHQRISQLINLLPQIVIVVNINGDLVYINDVFRARYPNISDVGNLNEVIIKDEFNAGIIQVIIESLRYGNNIYDARIEPEGSEQSAVIKGSIVRNRKGIASGGVYTVEIIGEAREN